MKKIILIFSLIIAGFAFSQNDGHIKGTKIERYSLLDGKSKLITLSKFEIILWDLATKSIIWKKTYKELGLGNSFYAIGCSVNSDKSLMMLKGNKDCYFIELKENKISKWPYNEIAFTSNDQVPVIIDSGIFEKYDTWLVNPKTGSKIKIGDKNTFNLGVTDNGNVVVMRTVKNKSTYYDVVSQKLSKKNKRSNNSSKQKEYDSHYAWLKSGSKERFYFHTYVGYKVTEIQFGYYTPITDQRTYFTPKFALKNERINYNVDLLFLDINEKKIYYVEKYSIEFKNGGKNETKDQVSYTIYSLDTGELLYSLDLINLSNENYALINADRDEEDKRMAAETQQMNAPENVLKRRLFKVQGYKNYVYNTKTKGVYLVVPDKPLYEGNLVRLDALNDDPKWNMEVYEKLENLENTELYKTSILKPKSCNHCNGKGYISNSFKRTVADYEYTTGKKLVETTTLTNSCQNCGGCGLVPSY